MRELKFRAWDEHSKRMVYHDFSIWCNGEVSDTEGNYLDNLMQFTGHKDKNNKDIYMKVIYYSLGITLARESIILGMKK